MKVNLLLDNPRGALNGYLNIDALKGGEIEDGRVVGDIVKLDMVNDGEAEEILACGLLSYFTASTVPGVVNSWLKKVKIGGRIVISDLDYENVCYALTTGKLKTEEVRNLLWGTQKKGWDVRKSGVTILPIIAFLEASDFKIIQKRIQDYHFTVTAIRTK